MYKKETQLAFEDFVFPFGELDSENEWVKLAGLIPWDTVERDGTPRATRGRSYTDPCCGRKSPDGATMRKVCKKKFNVL